MSATAREPRRRGLSEGAGNQLAGQFPSQWKQPEISIADLVLPENLPLSVPSELVRQRPDILLAEAQMHAANANIGVATAAMLPRLALSPSFGVNNTSVSSLFSSGSFFWNLGANLVGPILDGGTLYYQRKAAIDSHDQTFDNYRQTVLVAFEQVADTLRGLEHDADALSAEAEAVGTAEEALHLVQINYKAGLATYLQVLVADGLYLQAKIGHIQAVAQRLQDTVALYLALGGGWWNEDKAGVSLAQ
jgi:NodT family efflux transporter outer membrane factor (OMF) lipoprotein